MRRHAGIIAISIVLLTACAGVAGETAPEFVPPSTTSTPTTSLAPSTTAAPSTTTTTAPTTTTEPPKQRLVISGVGDTNVDPNYIGAFRSQGYEDALSGLQGIFLLDDLTIVNLECAAATTGRPVKTVFNFNCDVDALPILRAGGVDVANLANNHSGDFGKDALLETRANVEAAGIAPVGIGGDFGEAHQPAVFEVKGWRVAVLGFGGVVPWDDWIATEDNPGMASGDDTDTMVAAVRAADEMPIWFSSLFTGGSSWTQPPVRTISSELTQ